MLARRWAQDGRSWGQVGSKLRPRWAKIAPSWRSWAQLGRFWEHVGSILGLFWHMGWIAETYKNKWKTGVFWYFGVLEEVAEALFWRCWLQDGIFRASCEHLWDMLAPRWPTRRARWPTRGARWAQGGENVHATEFGSRGPWVLGPLKGLKPRSIEAQKTR